jgi:hypothetical protein
MPESPSTVGSVVLVEVVLPCGTVVLPGGAVEPVGVEEPVGSVVEPLAEVLGDEVLVVDVGSEVEWI